jgi:hypothetical protein
MIGIEQFVKLVYKLGAEYPSLTRTKYNGDVILMKVHLLDDLKSRFDEIEDYKLIFYLFAETNSSYIIKNSKNDIEIKIYEISELLSTIKIYDFSKLEL